MPPGGAVLKLAEVVTLVKAFATVAAVALPVAIILSFRARGPLLPPQRWRAVTWSGWHCGAACLAMIAVPEIVAAAMDPQTVARWILDRPVDAPTANRLLQLFVGVIALPLVVAIWWLVVGAVGGAQAEQIGRIIPRCRRDAALGAIAWLAVGPVVYLVNLVTLLVYGAVYGSQPPDHPLLKLLQGEGSTHAAAALILIESVVAAPIREELLFRGILQPWLCRHPRGDVLGFGWAVIAGVLVRSLSTEDSGLTRMLSLGATVLLVLMVVPVALRLADRLGRPIPPARLQWLAPLENPEQRRRAVLGLFGSAVLFAAVHSAVWPTPIPLVALGLGLGWLALRTQHVLAPIVTHALFNAVACVDMLFQVP
jgi:membrane protease YdiL (CAAX protease family)